MAILSQAAPVHARPPHQCTRPGCCFGATDTPSGSTNAPRHAVTHAPAAPRFPDRELAFSPSLGIYSVSAALSSPENAKNPKKALTFKALSRSALITDFHRRRGLAFLLDAFKILNNGLKPVGFSAVGCRLWAQHNFGLFAPLNATAETVFIDGRFFCKTAHCPYCASYKAKLMRLYLNREVFPALIANGLTGDLVTLTLPHYYNSDWKVIRTTLGTAFRHWYNLIQRRHFANFGIQGYLKALEAPVGINGLHPHFHLLFIRPAGLSDAVVSQLSEKMRTLWMDTLLKHGMK